jgi:hypothetical protein
MDNIQVEEISNNSCNNCDCSQENKCDNFKVVEELKQEETVEEQVKQEEVIEEQVKQEKIVEEQVVEENLVSEQPVPLPKVDEIIKVECNIVNNIEEIESKVKGEMVNLEEQLEIIKNQTSVIEKDAEDAEVEEINFIKNIENALNSTDLSINYRTQLNPLVILIAKNVIEKFPKTIILLKKSIFEFKNNELDQFDIVFLYKELFECLHKLKTLNSSQQTGVLLKFLIEYTISDNDELRELKKFEKEMNKLIDLSVLMTDLANNIKSKNSWCCCMM